MARGLGAWCLDGEALHVHRKLTRTPLAIAFADVLDVGRGSWHAGQWAGRDAVVNVVWRKDGFQLSSGFVLARDPEETAALMNEILSRV